MTTTLQKAFNKAADLPADVQKQLARQLMRDIAGELQWDRTLAKSGKALEKLAKRAIRARVEGRTVRRRFDEL